MEKKMTVIENENNVFFDVDDTLIHWDSEYSQPGTRKIKIIDPYDNSINYLKPHNKHVKLLKKYQQRGMTIVVWSAGGYKWAEAVVKALELEKYITLVMTKPAKYVDDLDITAWIGNRVYLEDSK
jgi:phosphoserine phosphatase